VVLGGELDGGFDFNEDQIRDHQVGEVFADDFVVEEDGDGVLLGGFKAGFAQAEGRRVFVDLFEEAVAQGVVDVIKGADDLPG
jgi:hypothetical protein